MTTSARVLNAALGLTPRERAEIAHNLLLSLEPDGTDEDADSAWADEIRRRLQVIRAGQVTLREWDDALKGIRASIASKDQA